MKARVKVEHPGVCEEPLFSASALREDSLRYRQWTSISESYRMAESPRKFTMQSLTRIKVPFQGNEQRLDGFPFPPRIRAFIFYRAAR